MKKLVVAIRDNKLESYNMPVLVDNEAVAVRQFGDVITRGGDNVMCNHPADFSLYVLGSFDLTTGRFDNLECAKLLAVGSDFGNKE